MARITVTHVALSDLRDCDGVVLVAVGDEVSYDALGGSVEIIGGERDGREVYVSRRQVRDEFKVAL